MNKINKEDFNKGKLKTPFNAENVTDVEVVTQKSVDEDIKKCQSNITKVEIQINVIESMKTDDIGTEYRLNNGINVLKRRTDGCHITLDVFAYGEITPALRELFDSGALKESDLVKGQFKNRYTYVPRQMERQLSKLRFYIAQNVKEIQRLNSLAVEV